MAGAAVLALVGCVEERVVARRGLLSGLPGAQSSVPDARRGSGTASGQPLEQRIRIEHEDGSITLVANSARDVLIHVIATLKDDEQDLFLEQVLSEQTRQEFLERGHDPVWAFRELKRRERDVRRLYAAMPYGEFTPGLRLETLGRNSFRVKVRPTRDMSWSFIDVVVEHGRWRLRWFGP